MREIKLTRGYVAIVDDEDYERVMAAGKWHANPRPHTVYAKKWGTGDTTIPLHRFIMGVTDGKIQIDHIDGNGLNNTRANLRTCTGSQNQGNRRKRKKGSSRYKGVTWFAPKRKWRALFQQRGKCSFLGYFASEEDAARAYDAKIREIYREFAHCNLPLESTT